MCISFHCPLVKFDSINVDANELNNEVKSVPKACIKQQRVSHDLI